MARTTDNSGAGSPPPEDGVVGYIEPIEINLEMERSFLEYSMSVIVSRALPDVRDGLKPVHRRILYSMFDQGLRPDRPYAKCAKVVGEVMGTYHPHGDSAIYDALVRMVQDFSMRHPLVSGHGNFGGTGPDEVPPPCATRSVDWPPGARTARFDRRRDGRLRGELRQLNSTADVLPARSRTSWSTAPKASPWAWRRRSHPTTGRGDRRHAAPAREPGGHRR